MGANVPSQVPKGHVYEGSTRCKAKNRVEDSIGCQHFVESWKPKSPTPASDQGSNSSQKLRCVNGDVGILLGSKEPRRRGKECLAQFLGNYMTKSLLPLPTLSKGLPPNTGIKPRKKKRKRIALHGSHTNQCLHYEPQVDPMKEYSGLLPDSTHM